jgi:Pyruvate/2-oxoacid:ferredoxin oxidoreductase delta subunit
LKEVEMAKRDPYEELLKGYEFLFGRIGNRKEFEAALRQTLTDEDVKVVLLTPYAGEMPVAKLERKAAKIGIPPERLCEILRCLISEGFIASYIRSRRGGKVRYPELEPLVNMRHKDRVVSRGNVVTMAETQVRKQGDGPMRTAAAHYMEAMIQDGSRSALTKTPFYRVLPVERTLTGKKGTRKIPVDVAIPDPREVLPLDVVSEMVAKEPIIAVAECFCRRTKHIVGEPCSHPMETCFYFNDLALMQIEAECARQIGHEEALCILYECEEVGGMVHNVSNAKGGLVSLCNCCACACVLIQALSLGGTNTMSPSQFVVSYDDSNCARCKTCVDACPLSCIAFDGEAMQIELDRCIGCGLCVSRCPESCLYMVLRDAPPKIYKDSATINRRAMFEASIALVKRKVLGRSRVL